MTAPPVPRPKPPTYADAIRLARWQMQQCAIESASVEDELRMAHWFANVWFEDMPASHFKRALEAAGIRTTACKVEHCTDAAGDTGLCVRHEAATRRNRWRLR